MSDESTKDIDRSALDHGDDGTEPTKTWTNISKQGDALPIGDIDVKSEWIGTTIYLPEHLREELELTYRERSLAHKRSAGVDLKKLRHYYPLVVALGLERMNELETSELAPLIAYLTHSESE